MLDKLGYNVSALPAGLGIGGIAVALALQNVLGDLFASLSITLDKPFVTGDFIIVDDTENTRFDRAHFKKFGDSAYVFEVVYYIVQPDYNLYMDCQQRINLELCRAFAERGIEFAYPTRTLHIAADTGPALVTIAGRELSKG